jgi:CheY-like chemotaxis protein
MVLRAELTHRDRKVIAHTTGLTTESVVVRTDAAFAIDEVVGVQVSLRRLLPPLAFEARVVAKESGAGLGYFPGVTLAILPTSEDLARLREVLDQTVDPGGPCRILVVEDSALLRDFVHAGADRFSEGAGWLAVDTVETAEGAIAKLAEHDYDLALVDLYLGGAMSGADLVRDARARGEDLAMIGFSIGGPKARDEFLDAGADLFLDKPVMMKDLFATIGRLGPRKDAP